jgi:hypothetical protein
MMRVSYLQVQTEFAQSVLDEVVTFFTANSLGFGADCPADQADQNPNCFDVYDVAQGAGACLALIGQGANRLLALPMHCAMR